MQKNPPAAAGTVNVEPIIARTRADVTPQLQAIFDKTVLSGMRIMFDKSSHQMTLEALNQPGPLATRISNGIIQLMYILWTKSNKTIPPQIIVPVTLVLTLRAFQFLQLSKDPEATKQVLGDATHQAVQGVMDRFGATEDKLPALLKGHPGPPPAANSAPAPNVPAPNTPAAPPAGGMLAAAQGQ